MSECGRMKQMLEYVEVLEPEESEKLRDFLHANPKVFRDCGFDMTRFAADSCGEPFFSYLIKWLSDSIRWSDNGLCTNRYDAISTGDICEVVKGYYEQRSGGCPLMNGEAAFMDEVVRIMQATHSVDTMQTHSFRTLCLIYVYMSLGTGRREPIVYMKLLNTMGSEGDFCKQDMRVMLSYMYKDDDNWNTMGPLICTHETSDTFMIKRDTRAWQLLGQGPWRDVIRTYVYRSRGADSKFEVPGTPAECVDAFLRACLQPIEYDEHGNKV
jgi:hypothetical protein